MKGNKPICKKKNVVPKKKEKREKIPWPTVEHANSIFVYGMG